MIKTAMYATSVATALILSSVTIADELRIERIAPENSILVIGTGQLSKVMAEAKETGFAKMWSEGPLRKLIEQASGQSMDDMDGEIDDMLAELGLDRESLALPTGSAGFAMFSVESEEGMPMPATLTFADFGEDAEKFSQLFETMLAEGMKNDALTYETRAIGSRTLYSLDIPQEIAEMGGDMAADAPMGMPLPDFSGMVGSYEKVYIIRRDSAYFWSTHEGRLLETLDMLDEDHATEFALTDAFRGVSRQIGAQDVYGVFFVQPLMRMIAMQQPMVTMVQPMIAMLLGDIQAVGFGADLNTDTSDMEMTVGLFMPNGKMGLTSLIDTNTLPATPPAFVSPNAVSYSTGNVKFGDLLDIVAPLLPMFGADQDAMEQMNMTVGPMIDALGTQMHSFSVPGPNGSEQLYAIECKDPQKFENAFGGIAPMMGFEPRDFLGGRIYGMDMAMMGVPATPGVPDSLGIGGGFVMMGTGSAVEQALRASADVNPPTISTEPLYQRARAVLPSGEYVGWGVMSIIDAVEGMLKQQQFATQQMVDQMREWDPELAEEMAVDAMASAEMLQMIDFDELRRYVGPMLMTMQSRDNGFVMKYRMLRAAGAE